MFDILFGIDHRQLKSHAYIKWKMLKLLFEECTAFVHFQSEVVVFITNLCSTYNLVCHFIVVFQMPQNLRIFVFGFSCFRLLFFSFAYNRYEPINFTAHVLFYVIRYGLWCCRPFPSKETYISTLCEKRKRAMRRRENHTNIKTYLRGTVSYACFSMKHLPIYISSLLNLCSFSV